MSRLANCRRSFNAVALQRFLAGGAADDVATGLLSRIGFRRRNTRLDPDRRSAPQRQHEARGAVPLVDLREDKIRPCMDFAESAILVALERPMDVVIEESLAAEPESNAVIGTDTEHDRLIDR